MPYFDSSLYEFGASQPSWWEKSSGRQEVSAPTLTGDHSCEVAIIGGGYTGLSAALHLARDHHIDVHLLEAGKIGWGASGRNGGFCCMGGTMKSPAALIAKYGLDETRHYYRTQAEAVELVSEITENSGIDVDRQGDCEMVVAEKPHQFEALSRECDLMSNSLGVKARMITRSEFRETHYDAPHQNGAFALYPGFGLHPLKYCMSLAKAAEQNGAHLHADSEVIRWESHEGGHRLHTKSGSVLAKQVIIACNGFMPEHLNRGMKNRIIPLQSHIIVTNPLTSDALAAHGWKTQNPVVNSRNLYQYFRLLPDNRFLIGGRGDVTGKKEGAKLTAQGLLKELGTLWPEWRHLDVEYSWRGLVCFTRRMTPVIGRLPDDPSVSMAYGYHGNGVNTASWAGRELARWLATGNDRSSASPSHLPAIVRGIAPRIPFGFLRRYYTQAGIAWHRLKDRLDG